MRKHFDITQLGDLYTDVQSKGIFADSKYFVDCSPRTDVREILHQYETMCKNPNFDLKGFVNYHFYPPFEPKTDYETGNKTIEQHINSLWNVLTRQPDSDDGTLLPLPKPYIVPGGRFREVYYWDSYFTMLGLKAANRVDLIESMVENFAYLIDNEGFIPNGNRSYYLTRSQPPFFALMVRILADLKGEKIMGKYLPQMKKEFIFWINHYEDIKGKEGANNSVVSIQGLKVLRYWDYGDTPRPESYIEDAELAEKSNRNHEEVYREIRSAAESGWDFSSRWFADRQNMSTIMTTNIVPVDLNCLYWYLEKTTMLVDAEVNKDASSAFQGALMPPLRAKFLNMIFWNEELGWYVDYDFVTKQKSNQMTLAGMFPLFFKIASDQQAKKVAQNLKKHFLQAGGLTTTLLHSGQQWDAPNGWAPLQWIAYVGLKNYGHIELAKEVRKRWLKTNETVFQNTGKMMEKYNVYETDLKAGGGEYPNQDGFGWTNGVYLAMKTDKI